MNKEIKKVYCKVYDNWHDCYEDLERDRDNMKYEDVMYDEGYINALKWVLEIMEQEV